MNSGSTKIKKEKFIEALNGSFGNISYVARKLGVSRLTVYKYIERWRKDVDIILHDEREKMVDLAESKLLSLVNGNDFNAIRMVLERMGVSRGWGAKGEINLHADGIVQPVIRFVKGDEEENG